MCGVYMYGAKETPNGEETGRDGWGGGSVGTLAGDVVPVEGESKKKRRELKEGGRKENAGRDKRGFIVAGESNGGQTSTHPHHGRATLDRRVVLGYGDSLG